MDFFIANDSYNADVLHTAKQELSIGQSDILQPSEAISRIMKAYPDRQLISIDYPSKFNNHHYAFYLGAEMMMIQLCSWANQSMLIYILILLRICILQKISPGILQA